MKNKEEVEIKQTVDVPPYLFIIGTSVAVTLSYEANHSIGWAIAHGLFGWFYVIYRLF